MFNVDSVYFLLNESEIIVFIGVFRWVGGGVVVGVFF